VALAVWLPLASSELSAIGNGVKRPSRQSNEQWEDFSSASIPISPFGTTATWVVILQQANKDAEEMFTLVYVLPASDLPELKNNALCACRTYPHYIPYHQHTPSDTLKIHMDNAPTVIGLFLGLCPRIILSKLSSPDTLSNITSALLGIWEGNLTYFIVLQSPGVGIGLLVGVGARMILEIRAQILDTGEFDAGMFACAILGIAIGTLCASLITQYGDLSLSFSMNDFTRLFTRPKRRRRHHSNPYRDPRDPYHVPRETKVEKEKREAAVDEVASLQLELDSAEAQRRRFEGEAKWAAAQGNEARVLQLGRDVKRYRMIIDELTRELRHKVAKGDVFFRFLHKMERNIDASLLVRRYSQTRRTAEIDLKGLSVEDAVEKAEDGLRQAQLRGDERIKLYVGEDEPGDFDGFELRSAIRVRMKE
jgi:hypothetical protein